MNRNQKIAVAVGASVILLMLLFPPFQVHRSSGTYNMGYGFILDPPKRGYVVASVSVGMLLVQWLGVLLLTALAAFLLKSSGSDTPQSQKKTLKKNTGFKVLKFIGLTILFGVLFNLIALTIFGVTPPHALGIAAFLLAGALTGFWKDEKEEE